MPDIFMGGNPEAEPQKIHYGLVLDNSSSMGSLRQSIVDGFNEVIDSIRDNSAKENQEATVTLIIFDSNVRVAHNAVHVDLIPRMELSDYMPSGMTALNDGIGHAISLISKIAKKNDQVFITALTDGQENASKEFPRYETKLRDLIRTKKNEGWTFAYIGSNFDPEQIQKDYGVGAGDTLCFHGNAESARGAFTSYMTATNNYSNVRSKASKMGFSAEDMTKLNTGVFDNSMQATLDAMVAEKEGDKK